MGNIISRFSCGIHYGVDPTSASDIYLSEDTIQKLTDSGYPLSVSGMSSYLKEQETVYSPVLLTWDMTSRCNFSCPFCYIKNNNVSKEISFSDVRNILDELISEGLFEAYLSGGECLLLEDFIDIYSYLKEKGVFITIFTNGSLIDERHFQCWKKLPPSSIEITLYDDDFSSKPFENVLKLKKMGLHVQPKFMLTSSTVHYFEAVKKWASEHGFDLMVDSELFDGVDDLHGNVASEFSLSAELKKLFNPERYENLITPPAVRIGLPCRAKKGSVHLSADLTISLCHKMKHRWDLSMVDVHTAIRELRQLISCYENAKLHGCEGCIYSKMCDMCYASAIIENGELHVPEGHCERIRNQYSVYCSK